MLLVEQNLLPRYSILVKENPKDWWILEQCTNSYVIARLYELYYSFFYNFTELRENKRRH